MKLVMWQKILVHLEMVEREGIEKEEYWPRAITQPAMAESLGKSRGMVSLALTSLSDSGLVAPKSHRVEGSGRSVMCYRLTKAGRKKAESLLATIAKDGEDLATIMRQTVNEPKTVAEIWGEIHAMRERLEVANNRLESLENVIRDMKVSV